jgi:hypothetical protein
LFPFYLEIGQSLLNFKDKRRDWSVQYLQYAYEIQPNNKAVNVALGTTYELAGNAAQAERFKAAAQALQ